MKRLCVCLALCLAVSLIFAGGAVAADSLTAAYSDVDAYSLTAAYSAVAADSLSVAYKRKILGVAVEDDGISFVLKTKRKLQLNNCGNTFKVFNTDQNFNLKAASLLTASGSKKKVNVMFEYDPDPDNCPSKVKLIELLK